MLKSINLTLITQPKTIQSQLRAARRAQPRHLLKYLKKKRGKTSLPKNNYLNTDCFKTE